jgi:hypothetical protein
MKPLRVLIATYDLSLRGGTQMYVRDLAAGLLSRGHTPIVYSPQLGQVAREIKELTIAVTDDLKSLAATPDLIHGNHSLETVTAMLQFPRIPALQTIHGNLGFLSAAPKLSRILRYIPVDFTCYERIVFEHGIPEEKVRVILNGIDLERFKARADLPPRARRALVFSNYTANGNYVRMIRKACRRHGLSLDVVGAGVAESLKPEQILPRYEIVFAKARCALEALAVGNAVVLCDFAGLGQMVTSADVSELRRLNFGHRTLRNKLSPDLIANEIAKYDPNDARSVSQTIRAASDVNNMIDELVQEYRELLATFGGSPSSDAERESREVAAYLQWLSKEIHQNISAKAALTTALSRMPIFRSPGVTRQILRLTRRLTSFNGM